MGDCKRDIDVKNRFLDSVGEGKGGLEVYGSHTVEAWLGEFKTQHSEN